MNKELIFRELYKNQLKRDEYFDKLPRDINMFVIDNQFTNNVLQERDMLIRLIFGEHADAVEWFLYEWKPGAEVGFDTVVVKINNIDEYIEYMKNNEGFE